MAFSHCMDEFLCVDAHRDRVAHPGFDLGVGCPTPNGRLVAHWLDEKSESTLVQHGLFGVSRNPIFLGMLIMLVGLLLILPTAATLTVSALGVVLIHVQVRLEEAFLAEKYSDAYMNYQKRVRRWI